MGTQLAQKKRHSSPTILAHVYCGQTAGWIKMKFGMEVGLSSGHVVLDADPVPPPSKGHSPQFSAHVCCGQTAVWIKMPLGREVGLGPGHIVLDRDPAPLPQMDTTRNFRPMSIVPKRLPMSATAELLFKMWWQCALASPTVNSGVSSPVTRGLRQCGGGWSLC